MKKAINKTIQYLISVGIILLILRFFGNIDITGTHVLILVIVAILVFFVYFFKGKKNVRANN